jgi:redox-sensitive bicupin YhaK (pirin superfamily)
MGYRKLRVINEDYVIPNDGFDSHPHREMEIFTYLLEGHLTHRDSLGNTEVLERGDVQFCSAGTGIVHSEMNHSSGWIHLLQIWCLPNQNRLKPSYKTTKFPEEFKRGRLVHIIASKEPDRSDKEDTSVPPPIVIHSDVDVFASILTKGQQVNHKFRNGGHGYVHVAENSKIPIRIGDQLLEPGDGAFLEGQLELNIKTEGEDESRTSFAEFLLFDLT